MVQIVYGDLLESTCPVIAHQVNCQGVMGSGVAVQIKEKWPQVYEEYKAFCTLAPNKDQLLGETQLIEAEPGKLIANCFGQMEYGWGKRQTNYGALKHCFITLAKLSIQYRVPIAMPYKIGCYRGGGDWEGVVFPMIKKYFTRAQVILYKLPERDLTNEE